MLSLSTGLRNALLENATGGGDGWAELFKDCVIEIYDGTKPADADTTEGSANMLVRITLSSGTFTPGSPTNGLEFGQISNGVAQKASGETWSGVIGTTGDPTWFRIYDNAYTTGDSSSAVRADGTVGLTNSGEDLEVDTETLTATQTLTISTVSLTLPA